MQVNGCMQYTSSIIVNDIFFKDLDGLLTEYFEPPKYSADLVNGDSIVFDSVLELINYDNFASRSISSVCIRYGIGNYIYIKPTIAFVNGYKSTIEMCFVIDNNDKCEEIKRKARLIFDKHRQSMLYTIASKITIMHICILLMTLSFFSNLYVLISPKNLSVEMNAATIVAFFTVGTVVLLLCGYGLAWVIRKIFPPIIFYLGENIRSVEKNSRLKSNIFWCVFVSAFVSVIVSIFV